MFAGYGIYVNIAMKAGSFLLEYAGERITKKEGEQRELEGSTGFRFFFGAKENSYWYGV